MKALISELVLMRLSEDVQGAMNNRLYRVLRAAILDGSLEAESRLPATRDLARDLGVARNTVVYVYEQLLAEGYVYARQGSGTYVMASLPEACMQPGHAQPSVVRPVANAMLSGRGLALVSNASVSAQQWGAFMPGVPDVTAFPFRKFGRIVSGLWRTPMPSLLTYSNGGGMLALRQSIAEHLALTRSIHCEPDQVLITEGSHQAIDLVTRVLGDPGSLVWVENPGYWGARTIFSVNGLRTEFLPVDAEGMCMPDSLNREAPRLIFVTPSHQYPLGSVMSLPRRRQLLALARQSGAWIIEDDYDSEFRFSGRPIASLLGLEPDAPVVYVGTFSKTLYPGLRIAYLVLPLPLIESFRTAHAELYRAGNQLMQAAIATFMREGHYAAHIRRMRLLYGQRRNMLKECIEQHLGAHWMNAHDSDAGLHLVLNLPEGMRDVEVVKAAGREGVLTRPLSSYYAAESHPRQGLLLGYACVHENDMQSRFEALVRAINVCSS